MRLKDVVIRNAKKKSKQYRLSDGRGLYLTVHPNGGKYWQYRYRYSGKEKVFSIGVYPETGLQEARNKLDDARKVVREGKDPAGERKSKKQRIQLESANDFKGIALEWHKQREGIWTRRHAVKMLKRMETDLFPHLGEKPISQITPIELLAVLRKVESRGAAHTAHRMQQITGQIFRFAVATGRAERDITADLKGALKPVKKVNHSRLSANELPEFLQLLNNYEGGVQTKHAVKLLMLTFVRTGELRGARKAEFDLKNAEWRIPGERMKMRAEHIVPLSHQVVKLFEAQIQISGSSDYMFPNRNKPTVVMSENTILYALYRMGYHSRTTAHGFRGTASTILHESGFNTEVIERQLAHRDTNAVRSSYNHASHLPQRRKMMQWWADYLEKEGLLVADSCKQLTKVLN